MSCVSTYELHIEKSVDLLLNVDHNTISAIEIIHRVVSTS